MSLQENISALGNLYSEEDTDLLKEMCVKNDNSSYPPLKREVFLKNLNLERKILKKKITIVI